LKKSGFSSLILSLVKGKNRNASLRSVDPLIRTLVETLLWADENIELSANAIESKTGYNDLNLWIVAIQKSLEVLSVSMACVFRGDA
jgi:hypothetical protein